MTRTHSIISGMLLLAAFVAGPRAALAAGGVADHANIFKPPTITTANDIIQQIKTQEKHDVRVETFSSIPDDQKSQYSAENRAQFFAQWAQKIGRENAVTGIVILICMDPGHVELAVGNQTSQRAFTTRDRDDVRNLLVNAFKDKNYDAGILDALRTIDARMVQNIGQARTSNAANNSAAQPGNAPVGNVPTAPRSNGGSHGMPIGGLVCLVIGAIIVFMLLAGLFKRNRGYSGGGGYNAPPPGGYPPGYMGGGYPQGGYPQGGGGGFGRGLLGGLLGGALGAWGYDRFSHPNQGGTASGGYAPPPAGDQPGMNDSDTSYSSSGGDFGSSDPGGGGSGGDFGGGGGSADSGGGGGDFGGGGGGDSGGGSGGDF